MPVPSLRQSLLVAAVLAAGIGLSACGIPDPYASHPRAAGPGPGHIVETTTVASTNADPAPEQSGTIPATPRAAQRDVAAGAAAQTPQDALARYARLYINWTARTVEQVERHLAAISLDGARAQALQAAARYTHDSTLAASRVTNAGTLVSVAAGEGPARGQWVVVSREHTTGDGEYAGLPASLHVIYGRVVRQPDGWVVSEWSPQD
jgi:hypothetical protein